MRLRLLPSSGPQKAHLIAVSVEALVWQGPYS